MSDARAEWEGCRWDGGDGHYESWFQRANHPTRPLAFWVRHTIFSPAGDRRAAEGELWAVWFDGEAGRTVTGKTELPARDCSFDRKGLEVRMPGAHLRPGALAGGTGPLKWDLSWAGGGPTSLLFPEYLYSGPFPKSKALCGVPNALFTGTVEVAGERHAVDGWPGSHNHNWGSRHNDRYCWAQVCGFDGAPDVFLECATAQVLIGPVRTPKLTPAVLNLEGRRHRLNSIPQAVAARASPHGFAWSFSSEGDGVAIEVEVEAPPQHFVALRYRNPPGGVKACLNSKIARCTLAVREGGSRRTFTSASRAAFEILCEADDPRVAAVGGFRA